MSATATMLEKVNRYIEYRRKLGTKLWIASFLLRSFGRYCDQCAHGQPLTVELALQWATKPKTDKRHYHAKRLDAIRPFARYLSVFEPQTQIPPTRLLGPSFVRTTPHIYTRKETLALMRAARTIKATTGAPTINSLRNVTILGLLACTGMRIGEILALKNEDVDLVQAVLIVRHSKNLPMRLVPVKDSTVCRLRKYRDARDRRFDLSGPEDAFIRSSWNGPLTYRSFEAVFKTIRERAGLVGESATRRNVRLHDFRHTFACNYLVRAYREKRNIDDAVHELSVYLGHAHLQCTYWYLTGIPALLKQCTQRFEAEARRQRKGGGQ